MPSWSAWAGFPAGAEAVTLRGLWTAWKAVAARIGHVQSRMLLVVLYFVVVGPMAVKSEMIRPTPGSLLGLGTNRLFGVAWAGEEAVSRVEVSTDGGRTWNQAELIGPRALYSWTLWEYLWEIATPGHYTLLVRAMATNKQVQPQDHDPLLGGYMIHHSRAVEIRVEGARRSEARWSDLDTLLYDMNAYAEENSRLPLDVELEFVGGEGI